MPRYYFNVVDGEDRMNDLEGVVLPDVVTARSVAEHIAKQITAGLLRAGEAIGEQHLEIADASGEVLFRLALRSAIPH
jgi:hypothetical protein